jgi:hypothetical protein
MTLRSADPPAAYPPVTEVGGPAPRGRTTPAGIAAVVVLALDAVLGLAGTVVLALSVLLVSLNYESGRDRATTGVAFLVFTAVVALACPAVAALVAGLRTRGAYLTGVVTTATVAVAVAAETAFWLDLETSVPTIVAGVVFAANLAAVFLLMGLLRPASAR